MVLKEAVGAKKIRAGQLYTETLRSISISVKEPGISLVVKKIRLGQGHLAAVPQILDPINVLTYEEL